MKTTAQILADLSPVDAGTLRMHLVELDGLRKEVERLKVEAKALSWILGNCELRDRDNTHVDIDDVYAAIASEEKEAAEAAGGEG